MSADNRKHIAPLAIGLIVDSERQFLLRVKWLRWDDMLLFQQLYNLLTALSWRVDAGIDD